MSITVALHHKTSFRSEKPILYYPHIVRLKPAPHTRTPIKSYSLKVNVKDHFVNWQQDPFGNFLARFVFPKPITELIVEVDLQAEMTVINPFDFFVEAYAESFPFQYSKELHHSLLPFLEITDSSDALDAYIAKLPKQNKLTINQLVEINQILKNDIQYLIRMETGIQTVNQTLSLKSGSCRDSAHLLVQILRKMGLASRFVSGYLIQLKADEKSLDGPSGTEKDFTDLHAWVEVFIPGAGWIGLDATSGLLAGEGHIPLAATADPKDAAPISGSTEPGKIDFDFQMSISRFLEKPRVTKPFSDTQWKQIISLGDSIDEEFKKSKLNLTMGGEPTFVSLDDKDSAEWNTAALGKTKKKMAFSLLKKLELRFAKNGLIQHGQGKWYPGEELPRWSLACYWRPDGEVLWENKEFNISDEPQEKENSATGSKNPPDKTESEKVTLEKNASKKNVLEKNRLEDYDFFAKELLNHLGIDASRILEAFEDPIYYLWKESNLPESEDSLLAKTSDSLERKRIAKELSRGIEKPKGFVIPLAYSLDTESWMSCEWKFRRDRLFLVPGDSPVGLRLPLDAIASNFIPFYEGPPSEKKLISREKLQKQIEERSKKVQEKSHKLIFKTALCLEVRNGILHIFLPPLSFLEHYLDLISSIEITCRKLNIPVVLEGYAPPKDPRLMHFMITPDPGVIEVNIHPSETWKEIYTKNEILYEEAKLSRLSTEKFMLDGRHTGTGGGNHITIGSRSVDTSPFLKRPDLLRSLLTFWQHHPSLSYLFTGLFIGPTSQAPRVDEARNDSLYELEIALASLEKNQGKFAGPWFVDRALRNLLIDVTGNTHRTEFSIDKLYSPDSYTGRLGLLEMRAFEMPPHHQMSSLQMLLLRGLIARFWKKPYAGNLIYFGTSLHDQYMLPEVVWRDFGLVIQDLKENGFDFELDWFKTFFEFKFPFCGFVQYENVKLEIRTALEPWHVMGEETVGGGTVRYTDSSVERLQVKTEGLSLSRHLVLCNKRIVPMQTIPDTQNAIAGVKFKAWNPASALHPHIPVQSPLIFEIYDVQNRCSIGGCTYHVTHPSGRNYETFPVNSNEAEGRRLARFWDHGFTSGKFDPIREPNNYRFPYTLDLRRPT